MRIRGGVVILVGLFLSSCVAREHRIYSSPQLSALDSVVLAEGDSNYLARPYGLAVTTSGRFVVSEGASSRILVYARDGQLLQVLGRRGRGPGEFLAPSSLATSGDSVAWVTDPWQFRLSAIDLATGRPRRSFTLPYGVNFVVPVDSGLWLAVTDRANGNGAAFVASGDTLAQSVLALPRELRDDPGLMGLLWPTHLALGDSGIVQAYVGLPYVVHADQAGRVLGRYWLPARHRRGFPPDLSERLGTLDTRVIPEIMGSISTLVWFARLESGAWLAVHLDQEMRNKRLSPKAAWVSVLRSDLTAACVDSPLPLSSDAYVWFDTVGDTLYMLQQTVTSDSTAVSYVKSYLVETSGCSWLPTTADAQLIGSTGAPGAR